MAISFPQILRKYWRFFLVILTPLILLPLVFIDGTDGETPCLPTDTPAECEARNHPEKFKCAYVIVMMAIFWVVEAMPLAVTALLPVLFLPLLGVQDTDHITLNYMKETNMMFICGLIIALAVEYCHLHKRIALRVMTIVGSSTMRLMLGVMITTMFLSMWISNTATTAMMLPIVVAVLDELLTDDPEVNPLKSITDPNSALDGISNAVYTGNDELKSDGSTGSNQSVTKRGSATLSQTEVDVDISSKTDINEAKVNIRRMFLLATCYSSNLGGTGTIIGSGTNLILQEHMKTVDVGQGGKYTDLTFATWLIYNVPGMLLNGLVALVYLTIVFQYIPKWMNKSKNQILSLGGEEKVSRMLMAKYRALGPMSFHEIGVTILFTLVIMLWFFRDPRFIDGWGVQIPGAEVGDSTAAMIVIFFLFVIPKDLNFTKSGGISGKDTLLDWRYVQAKLPWGIFLLMGGGFAISDASTTSGLSDWIGQKLDGLDELPSPVILIIIMILTAGVTEVASNAAVANVILPIILALSKRMNLHPLYLTLPAAISCSYAFMLPVATPPNAIVFATGDLKILDMVKTGFFLNLSCVIVAFCLHISYGNVIFDFSNYEYPAASRST